MKDKIDVIILNMEETKRPIKNILILAALMIAGFFIPALGLIGMILLLINADNGKLSFNKEERTMTIIGVIVLGVFFIISIIYSNLYPPETEETTSELLRLLVFIQ